MIINYQYNARLSKEERKKIIDKVVAEWTASFKKYYYICY